jgi:hypothetical protein
MFEVCNLGRHSFCQSAVSLLKEHMNWSWCTCIWTLCLQGITTYDYILAVREQEEHVWEDSGLDSLTTSPATSTDTGFSGYSSTAGAQALHHGVFCTPPRVFVEQDQVLSSLVLCGFTQINCINCFVPLLCKYGDSAFNS